MPGKKKFYADGIRFECQGSGRCCLARGEYGFVFFSLQERRAAAAYLGISTRRFTSIYMEKTDGEFHLKNPDKDCPFLSGKRCTIYEVRPVQCRTWPFWPENMNRKTWKTEVEAYCKGVGKGRLYSAEEIERILETS